MLTRLVMWLVSLMIRECDVQWVACRAEGEDTEELGVRIGQRVFVLYKGESVEQIAGGVRPVGKLEFGREVRPVVREWVADIAGDLVSVP